ncbi:MAG TPA: hypothetical protein VLZ50_06230 [Terracidiphilus sp.]|nr:hypothetical protein [Terracidiphilus sp.]
MTITEAPVAKARTQKRALVGNSIFLYAALGTLLGVLLGAGIAYAPRIHNWPGLKIDSVHAKTIAAGDVSRETKDLSAATAHSQPATLPQN